MESGKYDNLLKQQYQTAPIGLCIFDTDLRYRHINEWLAAINGLSVEEHLGRSIREVIPEVSAQVELQLRHVIESGEPVIDGIVEAETPASPHQKVVFQHSYHAVTSDEGVVVGVSCVVQDITERQRVDEELRESEERYVSLAEASFEGIAIHDRGRVIDANGKFQEMFGYRLEDLIGLDAFELVAPEAQGAVRQQVAQGGEEPYEAVGLRKDLTTFPMEIRARHMQYRGVRVRVAVCRDITDRKRAEAALVAKAQTERLLRRELDHRVRNNLASLISLIDLSRSGAGSAEAFAESIKGRAQIIASVHAALSQTNWTAIELAALLHTLMDTEFDGHIRLEGPPVTIPSVQAQAIGLVAHELATNSRKYGALGNQDGWVNVTWETHRHEGDTMQVLIHWKETGGPPIEVQPTPGLGTELVRGLVESELRGRVDFGFPSHGADHTIAITLTEGMTDLSDPDLQRLIEAWPTLPDAVRADIMAGVHPAARDA